MVLRVNIDDERVSGEVRTLAQRHSGRRAHAAMAAGVAVAVQEHLRKKNQEPNKLRAPKTNFYSQARDATFFEADALRGTVYIAKDGIRQRFYGGPIVPVKAKALTIPVHPAAHGRTASEFGGELRFVAINRGNAVGLLVRGEDSAAPVLFVLVKRVEQQPDPSVLPSDADMQAAAIEGLRELP